MKQERKGRNTAFLLLVKLLTWICSLIKFIKTHETRKERKQHKEREDLCSKHKQHHPKAKTTKKNTLTPNPNPNLSLDPKPS
jgi:hypothetical protein